MKTKTSEILNLRYPIKTEPKEATGFPSSRYFQVHFEYLENQLIETRCCVEAMQAQLEELSSRLSLQTTQTAEQNKPK